MTIRDFLYSLGYFNHKSIYFNFKYLPFRQAIRFPLFVSFRTRLIHAGGTITIKDPLKTGMIRIGFGEVGIFDKKYSRVMWEVKGDIVFEGSALFKFGSRVSVGKGAKLQIGNGFRISPDSSLVCFKKMTFGDNVRISWEVIIMDNDFHKIKTLDGQLLNNPKEIVVGNHVWIGMRSTLLKGTILDDHIIVGSGSLLNRPIRGTHQIIAGNPARVIKEGICWEP
jgi:acetyltransferase-like isoleucine patch superfamily enzyme